MPPYHGLDLVEEGEEYLVGFLCTIFSDELLLIYFKNDKASVQDQRLKGLVMATAIWKETYGLYLWPASGDLESHLPKAIRENIPEEWRKRVASEYLDVKLLFGSDVEAALWW